MAVNISVDLEGLTWGELRQFVRLADIPGVPDDLTVDHDARGCLLLRGTLAGPHGPSDRAGEVTTGGPVTPYVTRDVTVVVTPDVTRTSGGRHALEGGDVTCGSRSMTLCTPIRRPAALA